MFKSYLTLMITILLFCFGIFCLFSKFVKSLRLNRLTFAVIFSTLFIFMDFKTAETLEWFGIPYSPLYSQIVKSLTNVMLAFLVNVLLDILFWHKNFGDARKTGAPQILIHLCSFFIYLITALLTIQFVFKQSITGLATISGAGAFALTYSANLTIAEIFAGIAINLSPAFKIGDRISMRQSDNVNLIGVVIDMNWRSVILQTENNELVTVPNSTIARESITNCSVIQSQASHEILIPIDYTTTVYQAKSLIEWGIEEVSGVENYSIKINSFQPQGIIYQILIRLQPNQPKTLIDAIRSSIYYKIRKNPNINFGYDRRISEGRNIHSQLKPTEIKELVELLTQVDLFENLTKEEKSFLANQMIYHEYGPPEKIIREGEEGSSLYIIHSGRVEVYVEKEGKTVHIADIGPKEEIGIMSILTGAPRSANCRAVTEVIAYEIKKEALKEIFEKRPDVVTSIAQIVAKMELDKSMKVKKFLSESEKKQQERSIFSEIKDKIFKFFGL